MTKKNFTSGILILIISKAHTINKNNKNKLNIIPPLKIQNIKIGARTNIDNILCKKLLVIYQNFFLFLKIFLIYFANH